MNHQDFQTLQRFAEDLIEERGIAWLDYRQSCIEDAYVSYGFDDLIEDVALEIEAEQWATELASQCEIEAEEFLQVQKAPRLTFFATLIATLIALVS